MRFDLLHFVHALAKSENAKVLKINMLHDAAFPRGVFAWISSPVSYAAVISRLRKSSRTAK